MASHHSNNNKFIYKLIACLLAPAVTCLAISPSDINSSLSPDNGSIRKCSRHSIYLARQALTHEFSAMNQLSFAWFNDLTKDEVADQQKDSLTNMVNLGQFGTDDIPLFDVESSYFRPLDLSLVNQPSLYNKSDPDTNRLVTPRGKLAPSLKLQRRHTDKCFYDATKKTFTYMFGVAVWPIEHHLDLIFNFPKELRRTQPNSWTYSSATILVPKINFQVTIKQDDSYSLNSKRCPLDVEDVATVPLTRKENQIKIQVSNLASTNATQLNIERLFNDYTRPAVTEKLGELLRFHLSSKTLPLSI